MSTLIDNKYFRDEKFAITKILGEVTPGYFLVRKIEEVACYGPYFDTLCAAKDLTGRELSDSWQELATPAEKASPAARKWRKIFQTE